MILYEITQEAFQTLQKNLIHAREGLDLSEFCNQRKDAELINGIGNVFIRGALLTDSTPIDRKMGNTDYADISKEIQNLIDQGARSILLHVNSGGGTVQGAIETAEFIQNLAVPVVSYIDGCACSAAYKLVSGSTYIVSRKSSNVGNIGSIVVKQDLSVMNQAMGISYVAFVNDGAIYKSTGHLDKLTEDQSAFLQDTINEAGISFKDHVLSNRPGIDPEVFKAGWYSGQRAVDLGLLDMIGSEKDAESICESLMAFAESA